MLLTQSFERLINWPSICYDANTDRCWRHTGEASVANLVIQTQAVGERRATACASLTGLSDPYQSCFFVKPALVIQEAVVPP